MSVAKPLFGFLLLVAFVYLCFQMVPPFLNNYQFQDFLNQKARESSYTNVSEDQIRASVMKEARNDDIPLSAEQVVVSKSNINVDISVEYSVHVDLPVFPQDLHFTAVAHNRGI
jgi:hypothetical protein